jgi:hypothetical protein
MLHCWGCPAVEPDNFLPTSCSGPMMIACLSKLKLHISDDRKFVNTLLEQKYTDILQGKKSGIVDVEEDMITKKSQTITVLHKQIFTQLGGKFFKGSRLFLRPCQQHPCCLINIICPYATHFFKTYFKIILPSKPGPRKLSLSFRCSA